MQQQAFTLARRATFAVMDFETTGSVAGFPVEPWQVGLLLIQAGHVAEATCLSSYIRVAADRPFNPRAPGRHAEIRAVLAESPTAAEVTERLLLPTLNGRPVVAHNIGTERSLMASLAPLHQLGPWVDTLALTRRVYPDLPSKALNDVLTALGLTPRVQARCPGLAPHDALYDAVACAILLEHFLSLPGWENVTVEALADC